MRVNINNIMSLTADFSQKLGGGGGGEALLAIKGCSKLITMLVEPNSDAESDGIANNIQSIIPLCSYL